MINNNLPVSFKDLRFLRLRSLSMDEGTLMLISLLLYTTTEFNSFPTATSVICKSDASMLFKLIPHERVLFCSGALLQWVPFLLVFGTDIFSRLFSENCGITKVGYPIIYPDSICNIINRNPNNVWNNTAHSSIVTPCHHVLRSFQVMIQAKKFVKWRQKPSPINKSKF